MSQNDQSLKKRLYILSGGALLALYSLLCLVISPIYIELINDIAYESSPLPDVLNYLGVMLELLAIAIFYAALIFGIYKFCLSEFKGGVVLFLSATLYKYSANMLMDWYKNGSVPREWPVDVLNVLFYFVLEATQLVIILALINRVLKNKPEISGKNGSASEAYSFEKLYDKKNPLMRSALVCSVVVFLSKTLGLLINDVTTIVMYGLPQQASTVGLMALTYLSNLLFGFLCYVVTIFVLMKLAGRKDASKE